MNIERDLIITVLKLTNQGAVSHELIKKDAKIPSELVQRLLRKLQKDGLIYFSKNLVEVDSLKRLKLAVEAINLGADLEAVSGFLQWHEFEDIAAVAFERNIYRVRKNLHFKHRGRKWEIDIVACKKPLAICMDCKHWHHGMYPSTLKKIVEEQVERTFALADFLPRLSGEIECASWNTVKLVPAVLLLVPSKFKFYDNVPIVPVLQLQDFLSQLPAYADSLKHFSRSLAH